MKKFIIDIPDSTIWIDVPQGSMKNGLITFTTKSIPVEKLTPYTEPDRKAIEDEVWDFARKMISTSGNEVSEMWGCVTNFGEVMYNTTYQEAKAKYEEWLKQKDEIRVGDEVANLTDYKGIILKVYNDNTVNIVWDNGNVGNCKINTFHKTGRHFDEVAELLKKMRGEEGGQ